MTRPELRAREKESQDKCNEDERCENEHADLRVSLNYMQGWNNGGLEARKSEEINQKGNMQTDLQNTTFSLYLQGPERSRA